MEDGWIKLHRKMREWQYYQCPSVRLVFEELLFCANTKPSWFHGIRVKRGETMVSVTTIEEYTGFSRKTVIKALSMLEKSGEIKREKKGNFTKTTVLKFNLYQDSQIKPSGGKIPLSSTPPSTPLDTPISTPPSTPEQELKKEKNIKNIKISTKVDTKKDFIAPEFEKVFATWLEYKHQRKESYKSDLSLKTCYNKLYKLAGGDPHTAMAIVEQSMANNWAGLFALKTEINGNNRSTYNDRQAEREQLARGYAATIARLAAEDDARATKVRGA